MRETFPIEQTLGETDIADDRRGRCDSARFRRLGCPGMNQWTILVLGYLRLRLCLSADFDRLHELANQHRTLRLIPLYLDSDSLLGQNPRLIIGRMAKEVAFTLYPQGHKRLKACPRD